MFSQTQMVSISAVQLPPQVRKKARKEGIEELSASIAANGLLAPPVLRKDDQGRYFCVVGARRIQATKLLGWTEIPAFLLESGMEAGQVLCLQLVENLQREDVDAVSEGEAIQELSKGMSGEQIAAALGKNPSFVTRRLSLVQKLPEAIREQVRSGAISADSGYQLSRVDDPNLQADLAAECAGGKLSRDDLVRKIRRVSRAESAATTKAKRVTAKLPEGTVSVCVPELSLDKLIEVLERTVARAKKARSQHWTLSTFIKALRDQAAA